MDIKKAKVEKAVAKGENKIVKKVKKREKNGKELEKQDSYSGKE